MSGPYDAHDADDAHDAEQASRGQTHDEGGGYDAEHGQQPVGEALGRFDVLGWALAVAGGAVGLTVALALYLATAA